MNIVLIGTGHVAAILGKKIKRAGHSILQVYGRNIESARVLSEAFAAEPINALDKIDAAADMYVLAVADKALYELPAQLSFPDKIVVHTAGSVSKDVLQKISANYGVLYPLQSLRKELYLPGEIPLLIDASNEATKQTLLQFANQVANQVEEADDEQRMKLHVAAVVVSNFTNHLYALAEDYCKKEDLDFKLLYPLINETARRIALLSPAQLQTGPAIREDEVTINNHLSLLQEYPGLLRFYTLFTDSIREKK